MVAYLLWVIFANGITVFWPKPVQLVQLKADSVFKIGQTNQIAGAITINREISDRDDGKRIPILRRQQGLLRVHVQVHSTRRR